MDKEDPSTPAAPDSSGTLSMGEAITRAIGDRSRRALGRELGIPASTFTRWTQGAYRPNYEDIARLEDALALRRGWIYTAAGLAEPAMDVPTAIALDPELDDAGRQVLQGAYESTVAHCRATRQLAGARDHRHEGT